MKQHGRGISLGMPSRGLCLSRALTERAFGAVLAQGLWPDAGVRLIQMESDSHTAVSTGCCDFRRGRAFWLQRHIQTFGTDQVPRDRPSAIDPGRHPGDAGVSSFSCMWISGGTTGAWSTAETALALSWLPFCGAPDPDFHPPFRWWTSPLKGFAQEQTAKFREHVNDAWHYWKRTT